MRLLANCQMLQLVDEEARRRIVIASSKTTTVEEEVKHDEATRSSKRSHKFEAPRESSRKSIDTTTCNNNGNARTNAPTLSVMQQIDAQEFAHLNSLKSTCLLLTILLLLLVGLVLVSPASGQTVHTSDNKEIETTTLKVAELDPILATGDTSNSSFNDNGSQQPKLKPINFTLVDEIFQSTLADDDVAKRWRRMDSQLQDGMKAILKMIFPQIVAISQDAKVSGDCSGGILKWILSLRNLRSWAIKMLDATGKPTAGVFEGSLSMLGNYRQCLSIRAPDEDEIEITDQFEEYFRGQYCVLHLKPWMPIKRPFYQLNESFEFLLRKNYKYYEKTLYDELAEIAVAFNFVDIRMDLCVPSTCSVADIQRVAELLSKTLEMKAKVMRCDTASRDTSLLQKLDHTTCVWLSVPLALITLSLISTVLVKLGFKSRTSRGLRQSHFYPSVVVEQQQTTPTPTNYNKRGKLFALFQSLSIGGNSTNNSKGQQQQPTVDTDNQSEAASESTSKAPKILYGLRNVFVIWFIIVQMTVELKYQYLRESLNLRNMILAYWPFQIILNSTLLFEALIVISAFIYGYTCLEFNLKSLIGHLVNKYFSLMLAIVTMIAITIITPILAIESPVWRNFVEEQAETCKSTGYVDLLFLQNFINYDKICLPHTWLFCVELQLIVLIIPLMLDLRRNFYSLEESINSKCDNSSSSSSSNCKTNKTSLIRTILGKLLRSNAGLLSVLLIILGYCVNFILVYANQLPPSWFYSFPDPGQKNYYFAKYLTKTWTHASSFLIGLLAGHISRSHLHLQSNRLRRSAGQVATQQTPTNNNNNNNNNGNNNSLNGPNESPQLSHGSTSTIMAMEMSQTHLQATSSSNRSSLSSLKFYLKRFLVPPPAMSLVLVMLFTVVSTFTWSTQASPSPFFAALYDASSRIVWSLALSAIMFMLCHSSQNNSTANNVVERLLTHPISIGMGKISPVAYLVAPYVNTFVLAVQEQSLFPSMFIMFHIILGNVAIIYASALILAIVIERPVRRLVNQV